MDELLFLQQMHYFTLIDKLILLINSANNIDVLGGSWVYSMFSNSCQVGSVSKFQSVKRRLGNFHSS